LAEILKIVGIGWLFLVGMGTLAALSLAVANGGRVAAYPGPGGSSGTRYEG
jgi:hypothetical protein